MQNSNEWDIYLILVFYSTNCSNLYRQIFSKRFPTLSDIASISITTRGKLIEVKIIESI